MNLPTKQNISFNIVASFSCDYDANFGRTEATTIFYVFSLCAFE